TSALNLVAGAAERFGGRKVNWEVEPAALTFFLRRLRPCLSAAGADLTLLMGWPPWGARASDVPLVYWTDGTIAQRADDAPHWSHLSRRTRDRIERVEGRAPG